MDKKRKKFKIIEDKHGNVNLDATLFQQRTLFLDEEIDEDSSSYIIKQLLVLDMMDEKPIQMYVDSPGGSVVHGFAIIDIMQKIKSKVITIVQGEVASMGTMIAMAGNERKCFQNTAFMLHDMSAGVIGASKVMQDRVEFIKDYWQMLTNHIKKYTKLSDKEIQRAREGEFWMLSKVAKKKGLVDKIIK